MAGHSLPIRGARSWRFRSVRCDLGPRVRTPRRSPAGPTSDGGPGGPELADGAPLSRSRRGGGRPELAEATDGAAGVWLGCGRGVAGEEGFEPSDGGSKVRCLTTWLLPSGRVIVASRRRIGWVGCPRSGSADAGTPGGVSGEAASPAGRERSPEGAQTWMWTRGMRRRMHPGLPAAGRRQPQLRRTAVSRPTRARRLGWGRWSGTAGSEGL